MVNQETGNKGITAYITGLTTVKLKPGLGHGRAPYRKIQLGNWTAIIWDQSIVETPPPPF